MGAFDIQGINCIFQLKIGDDYKTVVCAKSFTLNTTTDMKETTTVGSGFWKESRPRKLSYTISFNGMLQVMALTSQEVAKTIYIRQTQFFPFDYRLIYEDNSGNVMIVQGRVYVTNSLFDASPANLVNATIELEGNGPVEILDSFPQPINLRIFSTGDPAIAALVQFKLFNSNGDIIFDSGQLPQASGGNLAHPFDVTAQVQAGSYSFFWQSVADGLSNTFDLDAPPTKSTPFGGGMQNENSFGVQVYDFTADRNVEFTFDFATPPPTCVPVNISGSPALPDAIIQQSYSYSFALTGSPTFSLSNVTKPSWMTIGISESSPGSGVYLVYFTGFPRFPDLGTNIPVSIDISNGCGSTSFSDTINVTDSGVNSVDINWSYVFSSPLIVLGHLRIYVNSILQVDATSTSSGALSVNVGDVVEAVVSSSGFTTKSLEVIRNASGTLYNNSDVVLQSYTFTTISGSDYTINGEIS